MENHKNYYLQVSSAFYCNMTMPFTAYYTKLINKKSFLLKAL